MNLRAPSRMNLLASQGPLGRAVGWPYDLHQGTAGQQVCICFLAPCQSAFLGSLRNEYLPANRSQTCALCLSHFRRVTMSVRGERQ